MYGLKLNQDLDFLRGRELVQVCIGLYQQVLNFDGSISIILECDFEVMDVTGAAREKTVPWSHSAPLLELLGSSVVDLAKSGEKKLMMNFSNGYALNIIDSNNEYESFVISDPQQTIIV
jgi:hypothetical protein